MFRSSATFLSIAILLTACVHTNATVLNKSLTRPPIAKDAVIIYSSADKVPGKYDEVAVLNSKGDESMTDERKMYESMRSEAAKLGANGVILQETKDPGTGSKVAHALIGTSSNRHGKSMAIYVWPAASAEATH
jgi:hypothetical protein